MIIQDVLYDGNMKTFIEIFGWFGTLLVLIAYGLSSFAILDHESIIFQSMNLVGALGIGAISFYKKAYQPAWLNVAWGLIAIMALIRIVF